MATGWRNPRGKITLCIVEPISTALVTYPGQHGYKMELATAQVAMTKNISDVVSLVVLSALAMVV